MCTKTRLETEIYLSGGSERDAERRGAGIRFPRKLKSVDAGVSQRRLSESVVYGGGRLIMASSAFAILFQFKRSIDCRRLGRIRRERARAGDTSKSQVRDRRGRLPVEAETSMEVAASKSQD
ncbi:unnamed protein product, partial [Iphiclides podalirius]